MGGWHFGRKGIKIFVLDLVNLRYLLCIQGEVSRWHCFGFVNLKDLKESLIYISKKAINSLDDGQNTQHLLKFTEYPSVMVKVYP